MNTTSESEELNQKLERLNQEFIDEGMPLKYRPMECFKHFYGHIPDGAPRQALNGKPKLE
jgi:hypothetical protein